MTDHGGGVTAVAVMLVVVLAAGMTAPMDAAEMEKTPLHTDEGDCRVGPSLRVKEQPLKVSLLAYVTSSDNVKLGFFLPGQDPYKNRDAVSFNSTGGTHLEVRGGKGTKTPLAFPRLIPEGWNTFRVTADERGVEVALVEGRDTTTLFTLPPLPHAPDTLHAEGRVARCSRVTPSWEVGSGEYMSVVLHLPGVDGRHQLVEVSGGGWEGGAPNLTFPLATSPKMITVAANTTFEITSSLEGAHVHFNVSKVTGLLVGPTARQVSPMHRQPENLPSVTGAGQSPWDPCTSKEEGPLAPLFVLGVSGVVQRLRPLVESAQGLTFGRFCVWAPGTFRASLTMIDCPLCRIMRYLWIDYVKPVTTP